MGIKCSFFEKAHYIETGYKKERTQSKIADRLKNEGIIYLHYEII
jgi:hypothetical protein